MRFAHHHMKFHLSPSKNQKLLASYKRHCFMDQASNSPAVYTLVELPSLDPVAITVTLPHVSTLKSKRKFADVRELERPKNTLKAMFHTLNVRP